MMTEFLLYNELENDGSLLISVKDKTTGCGQDFRFKHTHHYEQRAAQRGIRRNDISEVIAFGDSVQKQGYEYLFLRKSNSMSPKGVVVVLKDDVIVTCYRNENPVRFIGKKPKINYRQSKMAA